MNTSNKTDSIERRSLPRVPPKENLCNRVLHPSADPNISLSSATTDELISSEDSCSGTSKQRDYSKRKLRKRPKATEDGVLLFKKESVVLPKLLPSEEEFLQLVTADDVAAAQAYYQAHPTLNINCVNFKGTSALHIAVKNRSEAMVEFLLTQPNIEIGDTIMHAIRENTVKILVRLLDAQKKFCPGLEFTGCTHSSEYPDHLTPLMLAAHTGNYEVVALLVNRGHTISQPHSPNCICRECKKSLESEDALRASNASLASYRAMCAPVFLVHVYSDPILAAFRLARELSAHAAACPQQAAAYWQLRNQVSAFAVDLIGCCRTSNEVEDVLKQTCCHQNHNQFKLPRLMMAVDYKQKEFVAHPSTQLVLQSYWVGNWFSWRSKSVLSKGFVITSRVFITPLILFMCVVAPCHRLVSHYQIPLNKLITHATAYFVFLALVFYISNQDKTNQKRGPPNTGAETPLVFFVLGYAWSAVRMCVTQGPRRYFSYAWNLFDLTMLMLFGLTFVLWIKAARDRPTSMEYDLERKYWNQYEPTLLAEGTFCLASIFAYFRLLSLFQLNYHLGPLQVSLGKMTVDIYQYFKVFAIILCAFAVGLARFYQYYDGMVREDESGVKIVQVSSFISLPDTLKTLFWALFCMSPLESADVVMDNRNPADRGLLAHHAYTELIGYLCFGCFEVICVIVVLNMLIATMSNTYQRVIDNVATEWTFGKTEMYLKYMYETTLPSPYNLIPTGAGVRCAAEWLLDKARKTKHRKCCENHYLECNCDTHASNEYAALMSALVQRYFSEKRSQDRTEELNALRKELNSIKTLLENLMQIRNSN